MKKKALIFGVTGQDGSYLSKFLLKKNYLVFGVKRRNSSVVTSRLDEIYLEPHEASNFKMHYGDLSDYSSIYEIIKKINPHEIYNLAAQSHVAISFQIPNYTMDINALGAARILEAIKNLKLKCKFYQAGSSEMFGDVLEVPQNEKTSFNPVSPYAVSKVSAHWATICYREAYRIFAANGILFNHESPLRGENFVTRKIVRALVRIKKNKQKRLFLGNLYAKRDWGHAKDYVEAQWLILQAKKPGDYVISTGKQYSIKDFVNIVCKQLKINIKWQGKGIKTIAYSKDINGKKNILISCDKRYFRPNDVNSLLGNSNKARKELKWKPKISLKIMIKEMIEFELKNL